MKELMQVPDAVLKRLDNKNLKKKYLKIVRVEHVSKFKVRSLQVHLGLKYKLVPEHAPKVPVKDYS